MEAVETGDDVVKEVLVGIELDGALEVFGEAARVSSEMGEQIGAAGEKQKPRITRSTAISLVIRRLRRR